MLKGVSKMVNSCYWKINLQLISQQIIEDIREGNFKKLD